MVNLLHSEELCRSSPRFLLSSNMTSCPGWDITELEGQRDKKIVWRLGLMPVVILKSDVGIWKIKLSSSSHGFFQSSDSIRYGDRKWNRSHQLQMDFKEQFYWSWRLNFSKQKDHSCSCQLVTKSNLTRNTREEPASLLTSVSYPGKSESSSPSCIA